VNLQLTEIAPLTPVVFDFILDGGLPPGRVP
jgi:hypothetical protein